MLVGEQSNAWRILLRNDRKSRHRRIKKRRRYERLAATSQLTWTDLSRRNNNCRTTKTVSVLQLRLEEDSICLVKRCTKPDRKEFQKIVMATAIGFVIMNFIGFFVKLINIPIINIIDS
ncbi:SEC61G [Cordylochernes scorpioides]|uniref:SEC61G n=1 Tax=Cordylochernes scorpioides TaxID=51811 RepID=A0ABY6LQV2_9ARAC|nr:SEC61G [Cordylochernes scorpioides]